MGKFVVTGLLLLIKLTSLLPSLACPTCPPYKKKPPPPPPKPKPCPPSPSPPKPKPCPPPPTLPSSECPIDMLKLDACVDLLRGLVHVGISANAKDKHCPVLEGLVDLDAALCLCTTIKAKLLNIKVLQSPVHHLKAMSETTSSHLAEPPAWEVDSRLTLIIFILTVLLCAIIFVVELILLARCIYLRRSL